MDIEQTGVVVDGCAKTYADGTQGLVPTSLTVEPGEVMALLGPSGCGKTTLLRLVAGLEVPDAGGHIRFGASDVTSVPCERRGIGMVFQNYALFPQMTVAGNIGYGLRLQGMPTATVRSRVGELVDLVRLAGLENKRPADLSGGQRQRVALARALAVRPRVLLLDEPMAALDAKLKMALCEELAALLRHLAITTIHVTHDQQEALTVADRLAIMQAGHIVQVGRGETLYRSPADGFVSAFLGQVNRLQRTPEAMTRGVVYVGGSAVTCAAAGMRNHSCVLVRPEDVRIGALGANTGKAVIARRVFLGSHVRLHLSVEDQGELFALVDRDFPGRAGDAVGLHIAPEHLIAA